MATPSGKPPSPDRAREIDMQINLVDELEGILASKNVSRRAEILRRVTDLFVVGSGRFSEDQVELFDDVMGKLVENVERVARAQFGTRLATLSDAPTKIIRQLAFDDNVGGHQFDRLVLFRR